MKNFQAFRLVGILCLCLWGWQPNYTYGQIVVEVEDIQPRLSSYTSTDMIYQDLDTDYVAKRAATQKWYHQFLSEFLPFGFLRRWLGI